MRTAKESELERCRKFRRDCTKQCTVNYLQKASICMIYYIFKACVCYFLSHFYFSPNHIPSKTMESVFYFIKKLFLCLYLCLFLFFPCQPLPDLRKILKFSKKSLSVLVSLSFSLFSLSAIALEVDLRKILKFTMSSTA